MQREEFTGMIERGSRLLLVACLDDDPSEEQVRDATLGAGLPVALETESYVVDPIRFAVYVGAYTPKLRKGKTMDDVIQNAWMIYNNPEFVKSEG